MAGETHLSCPQVHLLCFAIRSRVEEILGPGTEDGVSFTLCARRLDSVFTAPDMNSVVDEIPNQQTFYTLSSIHRNAQSTLLVDKIYSLLGLASDLDDRPAKLQNDYFKSPIELFMDIIMCDF